MSPKKEIWHTDGRRKATDLVVLLITYENDGVIRVGKVGDQ